MNRRTFLAACLAVAALALPGLGGEKKHFGDPFTDAKTVTLADAMAKPDELAGKAVKIEGKIVDVCQAQGCWLVLTDGEREMRVSMKGHAFAVPKDAGGKKVVVEGTVQRKTITEAMAKHYAEESKNGPNPATIKGDQVVVSIVATGVEIED